MGRKSETETRQIQRKRYKEKERIRERGVREREEERGRICYLLSIHRWTFQGLQGSGSELSVQGRVCNTSPPSHGDPSSQQDSRSRKTKTSCQLSLSSPPPCLRVCRRVLDHTEGVDDKPVHSAAAPDVSLTSLHVTVCSGTFQPYLQVPIRRQPSAAPESGHLVLISLLLNSLGSPPQTCYRGDPRNRAMLTWPWLSRWS